MNPVLIACERSQVVCSAFRSLGIEAYSCDILPFSKYTLLWLRGLPGLMSTCLCPEYQSWTFVHSSLRLRSQTFLGIAAAMANQWISFCF